MKKTIVLLMALFPALAFAQDARTLSVEDVVSLALKNSKGMHISEMRVESASAKYGEVGAANKPTVKVQAGYTRLSDVPPFQVQLPGAAAPATLAPTILDSYALKVTAQQPLYTGGRLEKSVQAAEYSARAAEHDLYRDVSDTALAAKGAYWSLYKAIKIKNVMDENVEQVKSHLADVGNMVQAGVMLRDEQLKVQVQLSNALFAQVDAVNNVRLSMMSLNNIIGLPLETEVYPGSALMPPDKALRPLEQYRQEALENRAEVKAASMRLEASGSSADAARGGYYPQVSLFGDYYYQRPNQRFFPSRDQFDGSWDIGIAVSYDILDWGTTKYQTKQAEAVRSQSGFALEQLRDAITLEVNQSYLTLLQAKDRISIASGGVAQAEESYRITKNRFANGQATNTETLDAEVALLQAKLNYTIAVVDYEISDARLRRAVGAAEDTKK